MIKLARHAVREAMKMRSALGYPADGALCPFDVAESLEVPVRLVAANSLEGVYFPPPERRIFVGALRPLARQRFTCAHEIGHHLYGHGKCLATVAPADSPSDEFIANRFAAALLMPKLAILQSFQRYGADLANPAPLDVWRVSQSLGVGYETLVQHLQIVLQLYPPGTRDQLLKASLPKLRSEALGFPLPLGNAWVVDSAWGDRSVDVNVGDVVKVPDGCTITGSTFSKVSGQHAAFRANQPGEAGITNPSKKIVAVVRVSLKDFEGVARYRFLPPEHDDAQ
jgi:hypothetical protein